MDEYPSFWPLEFLWSNQLVDEVAVKSDGEAEANQQILNAGLITGCTTRHTRLLRQAYRVQRRDLI